MMNEKILEDFISIVGIKNVITNSKDLDNNLKNIFYIDGGSSVLGLESTVLKTNERGCDILRLGSLTVEQINNKFKDYSVKIINSKISPGSQKKHYSPNKKIRINALDVKENEALLNFGQNNLISNIKNLNLSIKSDLVEASHNFYNYINTLDQTECNTIAVVPIPNHGLGKTINDRLKRASHNDE